MTRLPHLLRRLACIAAIAGAGACGPTNNTSNTTSTPTTGTPAAGAAATPAVSPAAAPAGAALDLHITYTGNAPNCKASMLLAEQKAVVPHGKHIVWHLDGSACTSFDYMSACLDFTDDVIVGSRHLCGIGNPAMPKIEGTVTGNTNPPYQSGSAHMYELIYNMAPAGDPEIDINDGGGGVPPVKP